MGFSAYFLIRTSDIPLWGGNRVGVSSAAWYNPAAIVALCGAYALAARLPPSEWAAHDDDVVTLLGWVLLTIVMLSKAKGARVLKLCPVIALIAPLLLVCAMAFGFRQNVPN